MNYFIKYTVYDKSGNEIKSGTVKAKNKNTSFEAQAGFENHLKNKYENFGRLVVHSCGQETMLGQALKDIFPGFK